ncbi:hypothetical protein KQY30_22890 [Streptomyces sp. GMY02]|uniref:hypothetical protein n=1 Tax=Streptomyces sp. GMY02 TaxID=1333528 RepID=UPI001C2BE3E0|nr:hypothetical protein [Streptomyces sp. GMY02]QXE36640.1 hypothetical protein KQY30_22890 [Streptomyces sp. GMY02]
MPRPTAAQLAYGSATVVCSTVVMLLLSGITTGAGAVVIGIAALALGLLVTVTVPAPGRASDRAARTAGSAEPSRDRAPAARIRRGAESRFQHSLRR